MRVSGIERGHRAGPLRRCATARPAPRPPPRRRPGEQARTRQRLIAGFTGPRRWRPGPLPD